MTEQPAEVLLLIKNGGSKKLLVEIAHPFRTHREIWNDPIIQLTVIPSNQATRWVQSDQDYLPFRSLKVRTDVQSRRSGQNIDNRTGLNPQ